MIRNHKGQFASEKQAMIADLHGFIADWKFWAKDALQRNDDDEARRCMAEIAACRKKLAELTA